MSDIIKLLPDSVANQIAAGEVIQRPASVVKELLENSIDAGSTKVKLLITDAGKTLIQVIDNGCGMTETDSRLCFERHATSKIKNANDLFEIRTKGFRGEAMASIAAIAHVELKTRLINQDLGTKIEIEGSKIKLQEPVSTPLGTSISVKNLFYNVPARRNFLKANHVETKHIIDEFERVALSHPEVNFEMYHNNSEVFNLTTGSLRQRIVAVFGKKFNQKLVPVEENTDIVSIKGFIGKPEFAKRTRGEQYFFVNNRFIKNHYLHYAVSSAYSELITKDYYPTYFLYLEVNPNTIDINIHPTKTEIKFEDEKAIYAIINSAVRNALGKFNISPTLDFEQENSFNVPLNPPETIKAPQIRINPDYNPFDQENKKGFNKPKQREIELTQQMFSADLDANPEKNLFQTTEDEIYSLENEMDKKIFQLHSKYILIQVKSGLTIINQQYAHERILYEKYIQALANNRANSQQELFPVSISFNNADYELIKELEEDICLLGFDIADLGNNSISINGIPSDVQDINAQSLIEELLEQLKLNVNELKVNKKDLLAKSLAKSASIKIGVKLNNTEMNRLIHDLFACEYPAYSPNGKPVIVDLSLEEIDNKFNI